MNDTTATVTPAPEWIRCPIDGCALETAEDGWVCGECRSRFPHPGGIPCVLADPFAELERWRSMVATFVHRNNRARDEALAALAGTDTHPLTRTRLETLLAHLPRHAERVLALMSRAGIEPHGEPLSTPAAPGGSLLSYWPHLHRDWAWETVGSTENTAALRACLEVLPHGEATSLGRTLVLGAGACRLPYDLHRITAAPETIALDLHPLGLLAAKQLLAGDRLALFEFPGHPKRSADVVVERTLVARQPNVAGFSFLIADGLAPPVADASFDTVFTPWFIDQIPRDLATLLPVIHRVLRPGGRWLNHGPLLYNPKHTMLQHRYRADEVLALLDAAGFELEAHTERRMLYLECPEDTQGRTEMILTFSARRGEQKASVSDASPEWLTDISLPVPKLPGLEHYVAPHPMFAVVARLIDGKRTTAGIAEFLIANHKVPAHAAIGGVQACLREIHRALR